MGSISKAEVFDQFSNKIEISWFDISAPENDIIKKIRQEIDNKGIAFIKNVTCENDLINISKHLGQVFSPRHGSSAGVANIHPDQKLYGKGYTSDALLFHTDRSGMKDPPKYLINTVKKKSELGGSSIFVDGKELQSQILAENPTLYKMLRDPQMTRIRQEDGSFQCLPIFYGDKQIRCRFDDEISFTHSLAEQLPIFMNHLSRLKISVNFEEGEGYILNNNWWLHGRESFTGDREILRLLVNAKEEYKPVDKLILFDIDGTLLNSHAVSVGAFFKCMTKILGKPISHENCSSINLHGQTDLNLITEIIELHTANSRSKEVEELCQKFLKTHPKFMDEEIQNNPIKIEPCEGVIKLTEKIQETAKSYWNLHHIHFGILTGNSQTNAISKIKAAGINHAIFDMNVSVFGDKYRKRNDMLPGILTDKKNHSFNLSPDAILIIGDTPLDIECAKVNGAQVLAVATGSYDFTTLANLKPNYILSDLADTEKVFQVFKEF